VYHNGVSAAGWNNSRSRTPQLRSTLERSGDLRLREIGANRSQWTAPLLTSIEHQFGEKELRFDCTIPELYFSRNAIDAAV
jgi:hypothetical protein